MLHAITVTAKNVGASTIWNPTPAISFVLHGPGEKVEEKQITGWWNEPNTETQGAFAPVIDPDEKVTFFAQRYVPKDSWAVTYTASVRADSGDSWFAAKTVSNEAPK